MNFTGEIILFESQHIIYKATEWSIYSKATPSSYRIILKVKT